MLNRQDLEQIRSFAVARQDVAAFYLFGSEATARDRNGVITRDHLQRFQNMASFRNMLVHRYEKIDDEVVFGIFQEKLGDSDLFANLVKEWLTNQRAIR